MFLDEAQVGAAIVIDPKRQLALDAAYLLSKHGWIQNGEWSVYGRCIQGALKHASTDYRLVLEVINDLGNLVGRPIWSWNDRAGRTKSDVVGLLRSYGNGEIV